MTDKAMKCAEEIVTDSWISQRHILDQFDDAYCKGGVPNAVAAATEKTAAIIRKHYSSSWVKIVEGKPETYPQVYRQINMAFAHHWNNVSGFYSRGEKGKDQWYQHTSDDHNQKCKSSPTHWRYVEDVPHRHKDIPAAPSEEQ